HPCRHADGTRGAGARFQLVDVQQHNTYSGHVGEFGVRTAGFNRLEILAVESARLPRTAPRRCFARSRPYGIICVIPAMWVLFAGVSRPIYLADVCGTIQTTRARLRKVRVLSSHDGEARQRLGRRFGCLEGSDVVSPRLWDRSAASARRSYG